MYSLEFSNSVRKELKKIDKQNQVFIVDSLDDFLEHFDEQYEKSMMHKGIIKKLKGKKEVIYRLKLRSYRVIYKKYQDKLVILVLQVTTREGAYK